jgi:hypothetical protein
MGTEDKEEDIDMETVWMEEVLDAESSRKYGPNGALRFGWRRLDS